MSFREGRGYDDDTEKEDSRPVIRTFSTRQETMIEESLAVLREAERHILAGKRVPGVRTFPTGATRDASDSKPDYEGYLSPLVIRRFGEYMTKHRVQADGTIRDSDNWQKGIPRSEYLKSLWRHLLDLWLYERGFGGEMDVEESLCGILFNAQGYLHELLKGNV